jgi:hypothetical protein
MITAARGNQGHIFTHSQERNQAKKNQRADATNQERKRKDGAHFPPGPDARVEIIYGVAAGVGAMAPF